MKTLNTLTALTSMIAFSAAGEEGSGAVSVDAVDMYDFGNMDGVPEELADAVNKERTGRDQELYAAIVQIVNGAPMALGVKQVMVVLHKMKIEVPAESTVRNYLNVARKNGEIGKPSRQSYWTADKDVADTPADEVAADTTPAAPAAVEEEDDILAGLED